jgi:Arc/MetJ family transcription regulator
MSLLFRSAQISFYRSRLQVELDKEADVEKQLKALCEELPQLRRLVDLLTMSLLRWNCSRQERERETQAGLSLNTFLEVLIYSFLALLVCFRMQEIREEVLAQALSRFCLVMKC